MLSNVCDDGRPETKEIGTRDENVTIEGKTVERDSGNGRVS